MTHKLTTSEFLNIVATVHGDLYGYSKTEYKTSVDDVIVSCGIHGDFKIKPWALRRGSGCAKCGDKSAADKRRKTTEQFLLDAKAVHGDKYDYSKTVYAGAKSKLTITCKEHGDFQQFASDHITQKSGCRACQSCGFNTARPGKLYVLSCDNLVKVGITNRRVSDRVKRINKTSGLNFNEVKSYAFEDGDSAASIETELLRQLRAVHQQPVNTFDGSTECFYSVDVEALVEQIDSMLNT